MSYAPSKLKVGIPITDDELITWNMWLSISLDIHSIQVDYSYQLAYGEISEKWLSTRLSAMRGYLSELAAVSHSTEFEAKPKDIFKRLNSSCSRLEIDMGEEPPPLETFKELIELLHDFNRQKAQYLTILRVNFLKENIKVPGQVPARADPLTKSMDINSLKNINELTNLNSSKNRQVKMNEDFLQSFKQHDELLGKLLDSVPSACLSRYIGPLYRNCMGTF